MATYEERQLINQLIQADLPYDDSKEGLIVVFYEGGEHIETVSCYVSLRVLESGTVVATVNCFDFFNFSNDYSGYVACNRANDDALVARFTIDNEDDVVGDMTCLYKNGFDAAHFVDTLGYFAVDMDDAYPFFEEAKG